MYSWNFFVSKQSRCAVQADVIDRFTDDRRAVNNENRTAGFATKANAGLWERAG